jgi:tripartite-type tricarboxylate transporter receptor subunit TctC
MEQERSVGPTMRQRRRGNDKRKSQFWSCRGRCRDTARRPARPRAVPYPAGGIVDIVARTVTEQVGRDLKPAMVVEDRPGANSNIGSSVVVRNQPDGYTWLVTGPAMLANPSLYKDAGWHVTNFKCVGLAVWNQSVAVVRPRCRSRRRLSSSS